MCSTRTESISIPTWSRLISLKTGIEWKSPTSTKASTPSSAWPVTSRTSLPVLTARMTKWNSPSPSLPQAYQPSTTCRRWWERTKARTTRTTESSLHSIPHRHPSTTKARTWHQNWVWWNAPKPIASWCCHTKTTSLVSPPTTST